jgi:hypothetical protein
MEMAPVIARDFDKCFVRSEQLGGHRSRCFAMEQKRWFLIPFALDVERHEGKRNPDGVGMASVIRVLPIAVMC